MNIDLHKKPHFKLIPQIRWIYSFENGGFTKKIGLVIRWLKHMVVIY